MFTCPATPGKGAICGFNRDKINDGRGRLRASPKTEVCGQPCWGGGGPRVGTGARGRSHANAAGTIRPGASAPPRLREAEAGTKH